MKIPVTPFLSCIVLLAALMFCPLTSHGQQYGLDSVSLEYQNACVPNVLIVKLKYGAQSLDRNAEGTIRLKSSFRLKDDYSVKVLFPNRNDRNFGLGNIIEIRFTAETNLFSVMEQLRLNSEVEYVTPRIKYPVFTKAPSSTTNAIFSAVPNDPLFGQQWLMSKIQAVEAWDVWSGDSTTCIGIVDSEVDWPHEDLESIIKYNYADPVNGIDDDGNGLIDDFRGWDFGDGDPETQGFENTYLVHGTPVTGIAAAATNNEIGISGVCPGCKVLPIKSSIDSDTLSFISNIDGLIYATDQGCKVINCSWGSTVYDPLLEDYIRYAISKDVLVVAAAGNYNTDASFYPADLPGVLKVAATDRNDKRISYSNFGIQVDVCAPAEIYATFPGDHYGIFGGTSSATPVVSGIAAWLRSYYPGYNAEIITELIRRSCDNIDTLNPGYAGKLGAGRVNMLKAVTMTPAFINLEHIELTNADGEFIEGLDTITFRATLKNYFTKMDNIEVELTSTSSYVHIEPTKILIPSLPEQSDSIVVEFSLMVDEEVPYNTIAPLFAHIAGEQYNRVQPIQNLLLQQGCRRLSINHFTTLINSAGRIGPHSTQTQPEDFLRYRGRLVSYFPLSLLVGSSPTQLSDAVMYFNASGALLATENFSPIDIVHPETHPALGDTMLTCVYDNAPANSIQPLNIQQNIFAWTDPAAQDILYTSYTISNPSPRVYKDIYAGLFHVAGIAPLFTFGDLIQEDQARQMGYAYDNAFSLFFGIKLVSPTPFFHYSMDYQLPDAVINMQDGLTKTEKMFCIKNQKNQAGQETNGSEVAQTVSTGPFTLSPGDQFQVTFALIGATTIDSLLMAADVAQSRYDQMISAVQEPSKADEEMKSVLVYPNPATDLLNISAEVGEIESVDLFNAMGQALKISGLGVTQLDVSELPAGWYYLAIHFKDTTIFRSFIRQTQ